MDGWNTSFLLEWPIFRGYVSFREGNDYGFSHCEKPGSLGRPPQTATRSCFGGMDVFPMQIPPAEISGIFTLEVKKNQKKWPSQKTPVFWEGWWMSLETSLEEILLKKKPSNMFSSFKPEGWCFFKDYPPKLGTCIGKRWKKKLVERFFPLEVSVRLAVRFRDHYTMFEK